MRRSPAADDSIEKDLLPAREVAKRLSLSVRTLYRLVARGDFPKPIRYNRKLVRWKASIVEEYLNNLDPENLRKGTDP